MSKLHKLLFLINALLQHFSITIISNLEHSLVTYSKYLQYDDMNHMISNSNE
jgi:hypothetical protein